MMIWLTIAGMALATFATRALPLLVNSTPPPRLERALRYVPPALFAALVIQPLLIPADKVQAGPELWAGLIGALVAWRTRSVLLTVVVGMAVYLLIR